MFNNFKITNFFNLFTVLFFFAFSCGKSDKDPNDFTFFESLDDQYNLVINEGSLDQQRDEDEIVKSLFSQAAQTRLFIYKDNKIKYEIIGVGTGVGTWSYKDASINANAETGLFDFTITVKMTSLQNIKFHYRDRYGFHIKGAVLEYN